MYFKKIADEFCLTNISKIGSGVFSRYTVLVYRIPVYWYTVLGAQTLAFKKINKLLMIVHNFFERLLVLFLTFRQFVAENC